MSVYNTTLYGLTKFTLGGFTIQFIITFFIAFAAETIVGPPARKLAQSLPFAKSSERNFILAISVCMVPLMILIMSGYGLIVTSLTTGIEGSIITVYLKLAGLNFIVALPSQLLIVGPISRRLLVKYVKPSTLKETLSPVTSIAKR
ncbi:MULTISPECIES: DUF2798 domain-containing protein [unclassified Sporosarcina]|uniref:DUF2798 domain-containing protein n=1 Tax=unclassified Sporosarcina TaxID=2647733 RepID=UPI00203F34BD|nr:MULTISPECIES: DUF2798 domain-containing protein [unclassified Sporosarcina]GKV66179.1 hypothetical protein NCCP2331_23320 [Sporosarcina sp. NCCP-2331]GLB56213.1 hypothetical protein NCCP2378_20000 [Sporosarcina sp. NCCP-2378]